MRVERVWAMPSIWTFKIPPIKALLNDEMCDGKWADPFAGYNSPAVYTNDIEPDRPTTHNVDALAFLQLFEDNALAGVIFDPPYSTEQCLRRYTPKHNGTAGREQLLQRQLLNHRLIPIAPSPAMNKHQTGTGRPGLAVLRQV